MNSRTTKKTPLYIGRFWFVVAGLILVFLGLMAKIIHLNVLDGDFLRDQGDARTIRDMNIPAYRGMIVDRNGEPLAVSTPVDTVWANPRKVLSNAVNLTELARLLGRTENRLREQLEDKHDRSFIYLKRHVTPEVALSIKALGLPGVDMIKEYRRYYPAGEVAAHVVGFTDVDDRGQEGLELEYDSILQGKPGKKRVMQDLLGHVIKDIEMIREPEQGDSITLSIDKRIQYLAYRELLAAVKLHDAKGGSIAVLDVNTGEVLAMVNQPSFNPNNRIYFEADHLRNRAVTDVFEPGSVIKAFSAVAALESGLFDMDSTVDTTPGVFEIKGHTVRDFRDYGILSLTDILSKSSNVGISKIILDLDPYAFIRVMFNMGFGELTGSGFPGERPGRVVIPSANDTFTRATQAFGYGVAVTPLQLVRAFSAIGAQGVLRPVSFLKLAPEEVPVGQQVITPHITDDILMMLKAVINEGGSGTRAQIPYYQVAGKTGTARKSGENGYMINRHRPVFAGIVPASAPRLAMVVMIDEPRVGGYYGGLVAAPVFAKVMTGALRLLNIPPDEIDSPSLMPLNIATKTGA